MNITKRLRKYIEATFIKLSRLPRFKNLTFLHGYSRALTYFVCSILPTENKGIPVVLVFAEDVVVSCT